MPDISAKVASSSSVIALNFSCSLASSSSSLSTSFCSFCTDFSANSARASACFSLAVRVLICSLFAASLWLAFSSDTSRDFRLLASTLSALLSPLKIRLSLCKFLLYFIILFVSIFGLCPCSLQFLLKLRHPLLILGGSTLQHLPHPVAVVGSGGRLVQLGRGEEQLVLAGLQVALDALHAPVQCVDFQ